MILNSSQNTGEMRDNSFLHCSIFTQYRLMILVNIVWDLICIKRISSYNHSHLIALSKRILMWEFIYTQMITECQNNIMENEDRNNYFRGNYKASLLLCSPCWIIWVFCCNTHIYTYTFTHTQTSITFVITSIDEEAC